MERPEEYQGAERDVSFVRRFDDRLYGYCCQRFRQRWAGRRKSVPDIQHEGERGWFFPKVWIQDFLDRHGSQIRSSRQSRDEARRVRQVETARRNPPSRRFPKLAEISAWGLPPGTLLTAQHDAFHADGSIETFDEIRRRVGRPVPRQEHEQENLERMLEILHRKADAQPTEELAASRLTQSNWNSEAA